MKKISLLVLCLTIFVSAGYSQKTIEWINIAEVESHIEKDGKDAKRVFVDCYTDWCGWCKRMDKDTFADPLIAELMNHYFYNVKFDAESKEAVMFGGKEYKNPNPKKRGSAHELASYLLNNRLAYPSFSVLNPDLNIATIIPSYFPPQDFEPIVVFLGGKYDLQYTFEDFKKVYEKKIKPDVMKEIEKANKKK